MLKPEELKDKEFKIYLGMPMYGGLLSENTFHGVIQFQSWCQQHGVGLKIQTMGNESLVTRARNTIVSMMLDDTNFVATHLLFIDSDIGFTNQNLERLICKNEELVCGVYPRKCIHWNQVIDAFKQNPDINEDTLFAKSLGYNLNFKDPKNVQIEGGFCEIMEAATGMMLVKREVFTKMKKAFPERKYKSDQIINAQRFSSDNCYDFFAVGKFPGDEAERYLSEDYYFSRLWNSIGGKIYADVSMPLTHFGNTSFRGHVGTLFSQKDNVD
tara:strand:+ start:631 stop:1440 length:810 start_codon:yes stop_codon:yes gene_type:complete